MVCRELTNNSSKGGHNPAQLPYTTSMGSIGKDKKSVSLHSARNMMLQQGQTGGTSNVIYRSRKLRFSLS